MRLLIIEDEPDLLESLAEALREETDRRLKRERIDAEEAAWLAGCLLRNDTLDENERALLAYLKEHAPEIDPALEPLMARAGL